MRPESLKGKIKNLSETKNLSSQEVLQMFFFERFLERLSVSKYKPNFILKDGLLISSIMGMESRTTMDMDATVKGMPLQENTIRESIAEIAGIDVGDGIAFVMTGISSIREDDKYENFRVHLTANFGKIKNPMKIDITTGDAITPKEVEYSYPCLFDKEPIKILAYPLETILAEKYETIIKRNITTTRLRDFYDIYSLYHLRKDKIDVAVLKQAVFASAVKRNSLSSIKEAKDIIEELRADNYLDDLWRNYLKENLYIPHLAFSDALDVLEAMADTMDI